MQKKLVNYIEQRQQLVNRELINHINLLAIPDRLKESMLYSIEAGGKRIRPILVMASYDVYGKDIMKAVSSAIALEMIHTYSLIHDDLPAMDDDDYRRGKLTNHKVFDEATAILAGDALLTYSFEIITNDKLLTNQQKVYLIKQLSESSGPKGMVAGQMLDIEAENKEISIEQLEEIHSLKTGDLLKFAILAGSFLGGATEEQLNHLTNFAYYLGLLFQIQDDILDITGDPDRLGKPVGSDEDNEKSTYPKLLGLDGAIKHRDLYVNHAKKALIKANADDSYLNYLIDYIAVRDH